MSATEWTTADSERLTAELVIRGGYCMDGDRLDHGELVAILREASHRQVPRSEVARRIGWPPERVRSWARWNGCDTTEEARSRDGHRARTSVGRER
jgi:hypothetical protein